ncbi:MAG TPA: DNA polymerase III subunit gamma/tau [Steroidobacteraceae bacterium]|nr:DNA polymerase III subunit gamma/tau [Steroidobacteraceae bacterium]
MSYLVLARKWRPRSFAELKGQEHVMRALVNALESGRVHHAFLFTGTRGVGKTTIARILAKSLNCETGVTAQPCGKCSACQEIDAGRFVDLIEVDAASRTKVDDTRELLDNVQYAPARGRYKVYLIDEVHMLSTHSFNALLKTLEEPPPHVKFLLATTDPQKLPVTVLSRCLQFNLKRLSPALITRRLTEILEAEQIAFEPDALRLLARAADGSMRDALSLLDQLIAFAGAQVTLADARSMLGTIDRSHVFAVLRAIGARDARAVIDIVAALDERAPDYKDVLGELAAILQRVALLQAVPDYALEESEDEQSVRELATQLSVEDTQLFYQIALVGRRDLELAPDARGGFEMVLLRMLAFNPAGAVQIAASTPLKQSRPAAAARPVPAAAPRVAPALGVAEAPPAAELSTAAADDWLTIVRELNLQGPASQLATHCALIRKQGNHVALALDSDGDQFRRPALEERLTQALAAYFKEPIKLEITLTSDAIATPARKHRADADDRLKAAQASIEQDPDVRAMRDIFGATVQADSIRPADSH